MKKVLEISYYPKTHIGTYTSIEIIGDKAYFLSTDSTGNTYQVGYGNVESEKDIPHYVVEFINKEGNEDQWVGVTKEGLADMILQGFKIVSVEEC